MTYIKSLTGLLEYLHHFNGIVQSADFSTVKTLLSPQNASIILDSYTHLLCSKFIIASSVLINFISRNTRLRDHLKLVHPKTTP